MTTSSRIAANERKAIIHSFMIATAIAAFAMLPSAASAQHQTQFGTADEAKAMLMKAVAAVQADKTTALDMFVKGEGGFLDRDLYPFCVNVSDGKFVALNNPSAKQSHAKQSIGHDIRTLVDLRGRMFGRAQFAAAQRPEGDVTEVSYLVPNSGAHTTPLTKASVTTRVGDLVCGVSYYPMSAHWTFEQPNG
jgi:hypothetical protein